MKKSVQILFFVSLFCIQELFSMARLFQRAKNYPSKSSTTRPQKLQKLGKKRYYGLNRKQFSSSQQVQKRISVSSGGWFGWIRNWWKGRRLRIQRQNEWREIERTLTLLRSGDSLRLEPGERFIIGNPNNPQYRLLLYLGFKTLSEVFGSIVGEVNHVLSFETKKQLALYIAKNSLPGGSQNVMKGFAVVDALKLLPILLDIRINHLWSTASTNFLSELEFSPFLYSREGGLETPLAEALNISEKEMDYATFKKYVSDPIMKKMNIKSEHADYFTGALRTILQTPEYKYLLKQRELLVVEDEFIPYKNDMRSYNRVNNDNGVVSHLTFNNTNLNSEWKYMYSAEKSNNFLKKFIRNMHHDKRTFYVEAPSSGSQEITIDTDVAIQREFDRLDHGK